MKTERKKPDCGQNLEQYGFITALKCQRFIVSRLSVNVLKCSRLKYVNFDFYSEITKFKQPLWGNGKR